MLLLIDNYDSFTFNLVHHFGELGAKTRVVRNDAMSVEEALATAPSGIVLSPGPCDPDRAGICLDLVRRLPEEMPLLGVCLGHQAIAQAFGARVERCHEVMHGKLSAVTHEGRGLFAGLPQGLSVTRYHSLTVAPETVPETLDVTARAQSGVIMGLSHRTRPIHGVQFHPESIATEHGHALLRNFLALTAVPA